MNINKENTINILKKNSVFLTDIILVFLLIFLGYLIYQNLYLTIINPQKIVSTQLVSHQEKINESQYNTITEKFNSKKSKANIILDIIDPFIPK